MEQPGFDFTVPQLGPALRTTRVRRPLVSGRGEIARQASADGAALNAPSREGQVTRLWNYLEACGLNGATDSEIARDLRWPPNVVTARRNDLVADGEVVARWPESRRQSITSRVKVVVWIASRVLRKLGG